MVNADRVGEAFNIVVILLVSFSWSGGRAGGTVVGGANYSPGERRVSAVIPQAYGRPVMLKHRVVSRWSPRYFTERVHKDA